jgi:hypothetical protein
MAKIITAIIIAALCLPLNGLQAAYAQSAAKPANKSPITFSGGHGHSLKTAVVITGAPNAMAGIAAEYRFLKEKFGRENQDWLLRRQSVVQQDGKFYDRMELDLPGGRRTTVFFDISEFFGKL